MRTKFVIEFAAIAGFFWIFTIIDPFYLWNSFENVLKLFFGSLVILATVLLNTKGKLIITKKGLRLAAVIMLYFIYLSWRLDANVLSVIVRFFVFFPFVLLAFWQNEILYSLFLFFRRIIVFFSIGSIIISICSVAGLVQYIPHYYLEARSSVHEMQNLSYCVYGCIVTLHGYYASFIPRACGPLQEPGHFAVILGFVFLIDRFMRRKVNIWIVICGVLTFSMNFFILAVFGEIYDMFVNKVGVRKLKIYISILIMGIFVFFLLSENLQKQFLFLFYERNLEQVVDSYMSTNSLSGALDERINQTGAFYYEQFTHSSKIMYGIGILDKEIVLSDYRGLILRVGYVGFWISLLLGFFSLLRAHVKQRIFLIGALFLVYIHRAWMMQQPYIYFFVFLSCCMYNYCAWRELKAH
jgi:membrane protein